MWLNITSVDLWLGVFQERTALALSPSGYIIWLQMSLASKYSLPGVANCGAMHDHMMPCGVEIKHASTCMVACTSLELDTMWVKAQKRKRSIIEFFELDIIMCQGTRGFKNDFFDTMQE